MVLHLFEYITLLLYLVLQFNSPSMNILGNSKPLFEGRHTFIYLKNGTTDSTPVIIKVLKEDYPSPKYIQQFNNEYELTRELNIVGIRKAIEQLQLESGHYALVLKYIEGVTLKKFARQQEVTVEQFLMIAIQLAKTLRQLHDQNIIHKDLSSNNILIEPNSLKATIIDFGISSKVGLKTPFISNPERLEGTLAYISPEQTGRMNRRIDYRTDLYSLGVTFYELLTGRLPFAHKDSIKLIHQHLAHVPNPPHFIRMDIPFQISEIVLKLLAKNAESRYQSAYGLQRDLEQCLLQFQKKQRIESFPLAAFDVPNQLNIPEKLYHRDKEIEQINQSFNFVLEGNSQLVLISGNAGVGKTALVAQLHEPITGRDAIFVTGKFDQFQKNIPYLAFIQAIEEYLDYLLLKKEKVIARFKKKILSSLGDMGGILTQLIPKLELIIGKQPKMSDFVGEKAQNLLHFAFHSLIKAIVQKEHPLVIFIDDLQWADKSSLALLEHLISLENIPYLLLISAYRTEEVHSQHLIHTTINKIKAATTQIEGINLKPLDVETVTTFISDALHTSHKECQTLAQLIHDKTNGNPFFMIQFLKSLYEEGLLCFKLIPPNLQGKKNMLYKWEWNMLAIRQRNITDNVVRLLADRIKKLLPETQQTLQFAACIGNRFDLELLSLAYEQSPQNTLKALQESIEEGLIVPLNENHPYIEEGQEFRKIEFKFTHDRVRKAVYALVPELYKKNIHWRLGNLLQSRNIGSQQPQHIFDVVQQFNKAIDTIENTEKKLQLVELNLKAGEQSRASISFDVAYKYFESALSLLPSNNWEEHYQLTLSLHNNMAEAALLSGNFEQCQILLSKIFENVQNPLDKVKAWQINLQKSKSKAETNATIQVGIQALKNLGFQLTIPDKKYMVFWEIIRTDFLLKQHIPKKIDSLPSMTNQTQLAIVEILNELLTPSYVHGHNLFPLIICKLINLSLKHGGNTVFPFALLTYASICINFRKQINKGYDYGKIALSLSEKEGENIHFKVVSIFHTLVHHWKAPLQESLPKLLQSHKRLLALGDFEFAGISMATYLSYSFFSDKNLRSLKREAENHYKVVQALKVMNSDYRMQMYLQAIHNLCNITDNPTVLSGKAFDEVSYLPIFKSNEAFLLLYIYNCLKLNLCYLFGDYQNALKAAKTFEEYSAAGTNGMFSHPAFCTYDALTHLAAFSEMTQQEQQQALKHVKTIQKKMKRWSQFAPHNFEHKWYLIEAELYRVQNKTKKAIEYYRKAISLARQSNFLSFEAQGNELLGKLYLSLGEEDFAEFYLQKALINNQQWGAFAKVEQLINDYPQFLARIIHSSTTSSYSNSSWGLESSNRDSGSDNGFLIDASSLLQISLELINETKYSKVLENIILCALENTGAQMGHLILVNEKQITVEVKSKAYTIDENESILEILPSIPLQEYEDGIAHIVINYVMRTQQPLIVDDAQNEDRFKKDTYIMENKILSVFCLPILQQGKTCGLIYLENNLTTNAFSREGLEMMKALSPQIAIAIKKAQLIQRLTLQIEDQLIQNSQLIEKNKNLHKFTYTMSHNLREPVSNLLGLLELYNPNKLDDPINQIVINGFHEVANNMDDILRDLIKMFSVKNKKNSN